MISSCALVESGRGELIPLAQVIGYKSVPRVLGLFFMSDVFHIDTVLSSLVYK